MRARHATVSAAQVALADSARCPSAVLHWVVVRTAISTAALRGRMSAVYTNPHLGTQLCNRKGGLNKGQQAWGKVTAWTLGGLGCGLKARGGCIAVWRSSMWSCVFCC